MTDQDERATTPHARQPDAATDASLLELLQRALAREKRAEARDRAAEARDATATGESEEAALHRGLSAVDRLESGIDRDLGAGDRADLMALARRAALEAESRDRR